MNVVIFGGSGYIGTYLAQHYMHTAAVSRIYIFDIQPSQLTHPKIYYQNIDVRHKIQTAIDITEETIIFNLAAIHREPGHTSEEYFNTNIRGAENVCAFAESINCRTIIFTSSIAVYGRSRECRNEESPLYPETPYGISKLVAEKIHEIWLNKSNNRRLIICRPSVIFGPNDPGNIYRMIRAIKKGYFVFPGVSDIKKSFGYIYGLIESIEFVLKRKEPFIVYNYAETPVITMRELADIIKTHLKRRAVILHMPLFMVVMIAKLIQVFRPGSPIHPVRVKKASFPTNIEPLYLIREKYDFRYSMEKALQHWQSIEPSDF